MKTTSRHFFEKLEILKQRNINSSSDETFNKGFNECLKQVKKYIQHNLQEYEKCLMEHFFDEIKTMGINESLDIEYSDEKNITFEKWYAIHFDSI